MQAATPDRDALKLRFIQSAGWGAAKIALLAGDASNRRYDRLTRDGETAVLMDAPPEKGEDTRPFLHIAAHLAGLGLSPPAIIAQDQEHGFLLIEDLGDALYARLIEQGTAEELPLYTAATDALLALHQASLPPGIAAYDPATMSDLAGLAYTWYQAAALEVTDPGPRAMQALLRPKLTEVWPANPVLVLRDYHAENLLWLPDRKGPARTGLLDFQDAMAGHPAYDLISLLADARRDVSASTRTAMIAHYADRSGTDPEALTEACAIQGAQRNLRILGVFARLHLRDGKPSYLDLIPRVWGNLMTDLSHPSLSALKARIRADLPEPTSEVLSRVRGT